MVHEICNFTHNTDVIIAMVSTVSITYFFKDLERDANQVSSNNAVTVHIILYFAIQAVSQAKRVLLGKSEI